MTKKKPTEIHHLHYALNYLEGVLEHSLLFKKAILPLKEKYDIRPLNNHEKALIEEAQDAPLGELKNTKEHAKAVKRLFCDGQPLSDDPEFKNLLETFFIPEIYRRNIATHIARLGRTNLLKKAVILEPPNPNKPNKILPPDLLFYTLQIPIGSTEKDLMKAWKHLKKLMKETMRVQEIVRDTNGSLKNIRMGKDKRDYLGKWSPERFDRALRMYEMNKNSVAFESGIETLREERVIRGEFDLSRKGELNRDIKLIEIQILSLREDRIAKQIVDLS